MNSIELGEAMNYPRAIAKLADEYQKLLTNPPPRKVRGGGGERSERLALLKEQIAQLQNEYNRARASGRVKRTLWG